MLKEKLEAWYGECVESYLSRPFRRWNPRSKRRAIEIILRDRPEKSNRRIAKEMGVSREFVARARGRLVSAGRIADGSRVGLDGKRYRKAIGGNHGEEENGVDCHGCIASEIDPGR